MKTMKNYLDEMTFDVIIDVREQDEYDAGHVDGSILCPLGNIQNYSGNKEDRIAVYCRSGNRSNLAKNILEKNGYTHVTNIGGVIDNSVQLI